MRDSSIKTSIEKAIGEEPWLTEEVVRQLARPKRTNIKPKRRPSRILIPAVAALAIGFSAFLLLNTEPQLVVPEVAAFNYEAISKEIEDPQVEEAFTNYLKAIEDEDYASFEKISTTNLVASPKEIFEKYQTIDPDSFRLIAVSESSGEPVTIIQAAFAFQESAEEVYQTYLVDRGDGTQMTVSEDFYVEYPDYTPFAFPETLTLKYEEIPTIETISYHPDLIVEQASLGEEGTVSITSFQQGEFDVVLATDDEAYYLTRIYIPEVESLNVQPFMMQDTGEKGYMLQAGGYGLIGALFFDESIHFVGTSPELQSAMEFDFDENGTSEWVVDDEGIQVVRFQDGAFQIAILESQIPLNPFPYHMFNYEVNISSGEVDITTSLLEGEKEVTYQFDSTETLQKVQ